MLVDGTAVFRLRLSRVLVCGAYSDAHACPDPGAECGADREAHGRAVVVRVALSGGHVADVGVCPSPHE